MKEIKLRVATIIYKEPFMNVKIKGKFRLDVEEINDIARSLETLCGNKRILLLAEARCRLNVTPEGKKAAMALVHHPSIAAGAAFVKKAGPMLGAVLFAEITQPRYPLRIFRNRREAIEWLTKQSGQLA